MSSSVDHASVCVVRETVRNGLKGSVGNLYRKSYLVSFDPSSSASRATPDFFFSLPLPRTPSHADFSQSKPKGLIRYSTTTKRRKGRKTPDCWDF